MSQTLGDPWSGASVEIVHADLYPCPPTWRIPTTVSDRDTLFYAWKGQGWVERDGQRSPLAAGDLAFLRRGRRVALGHDPRRPLTVFSVGMRFASPGGGDPMRALALPERLSLTAPAAKRVVAACAEVVAEHQRPGQLAALAARGAALSLLALALGLAEELPPERVHGRQPPLPGGASRLAVVLAHIDAHLGERLTLATLARFARLSPAYFAAFFRARIGETPMGYLRRRRIEAARALLLEGDAPIERVAARVGFPDPFHFSRLFRQLVGASPRDYRARRGDPWAR
jgi:AraC-like DNA-binding protein